MQQCLFKKIYLMPDGAAVPFNAPASWPPSKLRPRPDDKRKGIVNSFYGRVS
jgi:hypothetical protein